MTIQKMKISSDSSCFGKQEFTTELHNENCKEFFSLINQYVNMKIKIGVLFMLAVY